MVGVRGPVRQYGLTHGPTDDGDAPPHSDRLMEAGIRGKALWVPCYVHIIDSRSFGVLQGLPGFLIYGFKYYILRGRIIMLKGSFTKPVTVYGNRIYWL